MSPKARQAKTQAEREAQIAAAKQREAEAKARIDAAKSDKSSANIAKE